MTERHQPQGATVASTVALCAAVACAVAVLAAAAALALGSLVLYLALVGIGSVAYVVAAYAERTRAERVCDSEQSNDNRTAL